MNAQFSLIKILVVAFAVIGLLWARYPRYAVDEDGIEFLHSGNVQGPTRVPVSR